MEEERTLAYELLNHNGMKRTLFSVGLVCAGFAIGGFETGDGLPKPPEREWAARNRALQRARIFISDAQPADVEVDPNAGVIDPVLTTCKYEPDEVTGTTPKFECTLENGDKAKVKYGFTREIPSEIAATRLLQAIGLPADRVSRVATVRCYGCPFQPFHMRSLWQLMGVAGYMDGRIDYTRYRDFHHVSVERNFDGEAIEVGNERGWAFYELDHIKAEHGGASKAEVDALRLMAVFLHHWDNKTANQRLTCPGAETADCTHPVAMIQDLGSEFGPKKVALETWRSKPLWADPATCTVSMKWMPYEGGTFKDARISEEGRFLLVERLRRLPPSQIEKLFAAAGFRNVEGWTAAFADKVKQIADRPACPATTRLSASERAPDRGSRRAG